MIVKQVLSELVIGGGIGFLELLLFFVAFFIPLPLIAGLLIVGIGVLYAISLHFCIRVVKEKADSALLKNFSFPALLLLFYVLTPDAAARFAIVAFSAQGLIKTAYMLLSDAFCQSA